MMKWQDAKMSKLQYQPRYKGKCQNLYNLTTPIILGSRRAITLLRTRSQKLGVEVASWNHHTSMKLCNVWNEKLVEDEPHSLNMTCSSYMIIRKKYYDLLEGHGNVIVILKFPSRRVCTYVRAFFSHQQILQQHNNPPFQGVTQHDITHLVPQLIFNLIINNQIYILSHTPIIHAHNVLTISC